MHLLLTQALLYMSASKPYCAPNSDSFQAKDGFHLRLKLASLGVISGISFCSPTCAYFTARSFPGASGQDLAGNYLFYFKITLWEGLLKAPGQELAGNCRFYF